MVGPTKSERERDPSRRTVPDFDEAMRQDAEQVVRPQKRGVYQGRAAEKRIKERVKAGFVRRSECVPCENALAKRMYKLVMELDRRDPDKNFLVPLERAWQRVEQEFKSLG